MPKKAKNPWPDKLKALRLRLGLLQREAAKKICVSRQSWISWENGTQVPTESHRLLIDLLDRGLVK